MEKGTNTGARTAILDSTRTGRCENFSSWFETRKPNPNVLKLHAYKRQVESALYLLPLSSNKARRAASASLQTGPTAPHLKHRARRPLS